MPVKAYPSVFRLYMPRYYPMTNYNDCKMPKFRSSTHCQRPGLALEVGFQVSSMLNVHFSVVPIPIPIPENRNRNRNDFFGPGIGIGIETKFYSIPGTS